MKRDCSSCVYWNEIHECVCAEECTDYDQWLLDEKVIEKGQKEMLEIIRIVYENSAPWDDIVISEDLHNRMERIIDIFN